MKTYSVLVAEIFALGEKLGKCAAFRIVPTGKTLEAKTKHLYFILDVYFFSDYHVSFHSIDFKTLRDSDVNGNMYYELGKRYQHMLAYVATISVPANSKV